MTGAWPLLGPARAARVRRVVAWTSVGAGIAVGLIGYLGHSNLLIVGSGVGVVALLAVLAPQFLLALFLVAGGAKSAPYLKAVPVDITVLTAIGVILAVVRQAMRPRGVPRLPAATALAIGLAALVVVSVLWSAAPDRGLDKALRFETFTMAAFFAPLILIRSRDELKRLMAFVVVFSLVLGLTAAEHPGTNQPLTLAGGTSEIELALYASSGAVAAIYLAIVGTTRWRVLWIVPAAVLTKTVIAAGSRGVLVGALLAFLFMGIQAARRARVKVIPIGVLVAAVAAFFAFGTELAGPAAQKYQGFIIGGGTTTTIGKRNYDLESGIQLALAHPLGTGASGYEAVTQIGYPHNAFIEVWDEQGIIGVGLLAALILISLRAAVRRARGVITAESILAGGLLIVLILDAMVSQSFTQFRLLWFAMGLAIALPRLVRPTGRE